MHRHLSFLAITLFGLALGGCSGLMPGPEAEEETEVSEAEAEPPEDEKEEAVQQAMLEEDEIEYRDFPPDVLFALLSAEIAAQRGRFDVTLANYAQAAADTRDLGVIERAMQIARALDADNAQHQLAELWLDVDPNAAQALRIAALQAVRQQDFEAALTFMERLFEQGEEADFENLANYARTLPPEDQDELLRLYQEMYERHPDEPSIGYSLALMKDSMGRSQQALDLIKPILEEHDNFQPALTLKGKLLYDLDRPDEAIDHLRTETRRFPENRRLGTLYARILVDQGQLQAAEDEFATLMERFPQATGLKLSRALVALENDNLEVAEPLLEELVEQGAHASDAHFYLGRIADEREEEQRALEHYQQVDSGAHFFSALSRASYIRAEDGELVSVRENLERLRAQMPDEHERLWLIEINLLLDMDEHEKALEVSKNALEDYPGNSNIRYARAMLYEREERLEEMEDDLRTIIEEEPDNAIALNALGYTLTVHTDRHEEAYDYVMQAYELAPDNPAIIDSVGWIYYKKGELEKALTYLTEAYEALPDPEIAAHLGQVLWEKDREDDARTVLRRALDEADDEEDLSPILDTLEGLGLTPEDL